MRIFLLVFLGCMIGAEAGLYARLAALEGQSGFYYLENTLTREQIADFWERASDDAKREILDIALFRESRGKVLKNEDLNRESKVKLIETAGNMNLVTPDRLMAGTYVTDSDPKGCVLSRKTADSLFGSFEVTGEQVVLGNSLYIVRGIVDLDGQICMIQGKPGKTYACLRALAPGIPLSVVRQRLAGILMEEKGWISECDLYLGIGRILLSLPLWVVLFLFLGRIRRMIPETFRFLIPIAGFGGICVLLLMSLHFSDDYIPSAWSDFPFWTQLFDEKKEAFLSLLNHPLYYADSRMLGSLAGILGTTVGVCGILLMFNMVVFNRLRFEIKQYLKA